MEGCGYARYLSAHRTGTGLDAANSLGMIDVAENWVERVGPQPPGTWMWTYRFDPGDGDRLWGCAHGLVGTAGGEDRARRTVEAFAAAEALAGRVALERLPEPVAVDKDGNTGGPGGQTGRKGTGKPPRPPDAGGRPRSGREAAAFWGGPMGLLRVLVGVVVSEAVEGGLPEARGDGIYDELCDAIERQEGRPCPCGDCGGALTLDDVALRVLDRMAPVLNRAPGEGGDCYGYGD